MGCMVDSCRECSNCKVGEAQYCKVAGWNHVYNDMKKYGHISGNQDTQTLGGYTASQVTHEDFVLRMPANLDLAAASPLLCAGVTMWDPLRHWGFTTGDQKKTVGIIGVGGLGTMGIKLAAALGHRVVAISTSASKEALAKAKGASAFVVSTDPESMKAEAGKIDIILNTVGANHELSHYIPLLNTNGNLVQLGLVT